MDRYLEELRGYLNSLPLSEQDDAIEYYQEYLMDAGVKSYDEAVQKLGSAHKIANKILTDRAVENVENEIRIPKKLRKRNSAMVVWLVILALLSSPITIPIAILLVSIVFIVAVMLLMIIFIPLSIGVVTIYAGFKVLFVQWAVGLFYIGVGILSLGIMIFAIPATTLGLNAIGKLAVRVYRSAFGKRKEGLSK